MNKNVCISIILISACFTMGCSQAEIARARASLLESGILQDSADYLVPSSNLKAPLKTAIPQPVEVDEDEASKTPSATQFQPVPKPTPTGRKTPGAGRGKSNGKGKKAKMQNRR